MFSLKAFLGLDGSAYEAGLKKAEAQTDKFSSKVEGIKGKISSALSGNFSSAFGGSFLGGAVGGIVGSIVGKVTGSAKEALDRFKEKATEIKNGMATTGLDSQGYQRFSNTLDAAGSSGEAGARSLEHLAEATEKIKEGGEGSEKLAKQFAVLGVSLDDIKRKDYKQIFFDIAAGMKEADLSAEKLTAIKEILGKGGLEMLPAFKLGFDSTAANRNIVSDADLEKLKELKKLGNEASAPWRDLGNSIASQFISVKLLATKAASSIDPLRGIFKLFGGTADNSQDPHSAAMEKRLHALDEEKAKRQAEAAATKKANDERLKKEAELKKHFQDREESIGKQAAMEQFSLLTDQEKLKLLKAQAEVLRHQKGFIDTELLNGDKTGQHAMELQQVQLSIAQNRKMQGDIADRMSKLDNQVFTAAALGVSGHSKLGAQTDNPFARPEVRDLIKALFELNRTVASSNRSSSPLPQSSEYQ